MAIEGKKKYSVYLTEENVEYLRSLLPPGQQNDGLSGIVDASITQMAKLARKAKKHNGKLTVGWMGLFKMFLSDITDIRFASEHSEKKKPAVAGSMERNKTTG